MSLYSNMISGASIQNSKHLGADLVCVVSEPVFSGEVFLGGVRIFFISTLKFDDLLEPWDDEGVETSSLL